MDNQVQPLTNPQDDKVDHNSRAGRTWVLGLELCLWVCPLGSQSLIFFGLLLLKLSVASAK
jgi:hypothetical protein